MCNSCCGCWYVVYVVGSLLCGVNTRFSLYIITSGQPVLRTECLGNVNPPRDQQRVNIFSQQKWKLTVDPLCVDCSSAPPPHRINRGDCLFMRKWKVTVDPLHVNCRSAPQDQQCWLPLRWSSIASTLSIDHPYIDHWSAPPQDQQCWSPPHWLLIIDRLRIDQYRFRLCNLLI